MHICLQLVYRDQPVCSSVHSALILSSSTYEYKTKFGIHKPCVTRLL